MGKFNQEGFHQGQHQMKLSLNNPRIFSTGCQKRELDTMAIDFD